MPQAPAAATLGRPVIVAGVVVGVCAVSVSAVLVRVADAPAVAIAFWRCALGAAALAPFAVRARRAAPPLPGRQRWQIVAAGLFLAAHFWLWIGSLSFTTVASSVVLVSMTPVFVGAGAALVLGEPPSRRTWAGIGLALTGTIAIATSDLTTADLGWRALLGDLLALGGAIAMAGYLLIGRSCRATLPLSVYAGSVYGVAAAALGLACLATGAPLSGYDTTTWLAILGIVVGPQLLGHTVFNWLLSSVTPTVIAVAALAEPVGATALAWTLLDEMPTPWFWAGAPPILVGVWLALTRSNAARRSRRGP